MRFDLETIVIESAPLFVPKSGDVWQWCEQVSRRLKLFAKANAPPNRTMSRTGRNYATGALQAGIGSKVVIVGPKQLDVWLWSRGEHMTYVLGGTANQGRNYIYSRLGYANRKEISSWFRQRQLGGIRGAEFQGLTMGPLSPRYPGNAFQLRVHGQKANPYLQDAYVETQRFHSSLPAKRFARSGLILD
jgi:hypothetical protein